MGHYFRALSLRLYSKHQWHIAGILFVSYLVVSYVAATYIPASAQLYPAIPLALCALYFGGLRLFPVVYGTAFLSVILTGVIAPPILIFVPFAATLQACVGAYILRAVHIDPLFRRYRDTAYLIAMVAGVSFIEPTLRALALFIHGGSYPLLNWSYAYVAAVFCFFILTPFILRWFTKTWFTRTPLEVVETGAVFFVLIVIDFTLFMQEVHTIFGISLIYVLLIPLFLIALRLRPRFLTVALVITSMFALSGVFAHISAPAIASSLFNIELFLIVLSVVFFIVTSIEEELRVTGSLMRSQLATLQNAVARVSSESKAKNDFIAILAHELRNPLAPVVSGIELLQLKGSRDKEDAKTLDMMMGRMDVVRRLLDDLLEISRISEGKVAFKQGTVDLTVVLKRAVLSTGHYRKELRQRIVFEASTVPLPIVGDSVRLEQIFSNLLTNASKYSDSGDTVTIVVRHGSGMVEVEISDEGVGLNAHAVESIFTPFYQLQQGERSTKGLGIGLALVRSFVEMHSGSVSAASDGIGLGSRFTVRLPLSHRDTLITGHYAHKRHTSASGKKRGSVALVLDDSDAASENIGSLLELEGISVIYAFQARHAIQQAFNLLPEIVFINIDTLHQDGRAIARTLHERGFKGHLIALTNSRAKTIKDAGANGLFEQYLSRPVELSDLKRVLSELKPVAK